MSLILTISDSSVLFSLVFVSGIRTLQGRKREIVMFRSLAFRAVESIRVT